MKHNKKRKQMKIQVLTLNTDNKWNFQQLAPLNDLTLLMIRIKTNAGYGWLSNLNLPLNVKYVVIHIFGHMENFEDIAKKIKTPRGCNLLIENDNKVFLNDKIVTEENYLNTIDYIKEITDYGFNADIVDKMTDFYDKVPLMNKWQVTSRTDMKRLLEINDFLASL